jgi:hypothetical protein
MSVGGETAIQSNQSGGARQPNVVQGSVCPPADQSVAVGSQSLPPERTGDRSAGLACSADDYQAKERPQEQSSSADASKYFRRDAAKAREPACDVDRERFGGIAREFSRTTELARHQGNAELEARSLVEELTIAEQLGQTEKLNALSERFAVVSKVAALERASQQVASLAAKEFLTPANTKGQERFVAFASGASGSPKVIFTEAFSRLSDAKKVEVLKELSRVGMVEHYRQRAQAEIDPAKRRFYEAKASFSEGKIEAGRLGFMDVKRLSEGRKDDPELAAMREEVAQKTRQFSLAAVKRLQSAHASFMEQRTSGLGFAPMYRGHYGRTRDLFVEVRKALEAGKANTIEEAMQYVHDAGVQSAYTLGSSKKTVVAAYRESPDPDLARLMALETREGLEKCQTPDGRRQQLLSTARAIRHRAGSYALAAAMLEEVLGKQMEETAAGLPKGMADQIRSEETGKRTNVRKKVVADLRKMKKKDPKGYERQFPEGDPLERPELLEQVVQSSIETTIAHRIRQCVFYAIDQHVKDGGLKGDPIAKQAWEVYDDMMDPLDKSLHFSDAARDAIIDEVIITAVTMPSTMGIGSAVRATVGGSRLAVRLMSQGGGRAVATRLAIIGAGAVAEGSVMTATQSTISGHADAKSFGLNVAMSFAFGIGGRIGGHLTKGLGLGEEAMKGAGLLARVGKSSSSFALTITLQSEIGMGLSYLEDIAADSGPSKTAWQRFGGSFMRMVAFHYGTKAMNLATRGEMFRAEQAAEARFEKAREQRIALMAKGSSDGLAGGNVVEPVLQEASVPQREAPLGLRIDERCVPASKAQELKRVLGEREAASLTRGELRKVVARLVRESNWKFKEIQDVFGVEGMRALGYGTELPFGFTSRAQYGVFEKGVAKMLLDAGIPIFDPEVKILVQGSSVRGKKHSTGTPYMWEADPSKPGKEGKRSDVDIAVVVSPRLYAELVVRRVRWVMNENRSNSADQKTAIVATLKWLKTIKVDPRLATNEKDMLNTRWRAETKQMLEAELEKMLGESVDLSVRTANEEGVEWWQSPRENGEEVKGGASKKLAKAMSAKSLGIFNTDQAVRTEYGKFREEMALQGFDRGVQVSFMLPESKLYPKPDEMMIISAAQAYPSATTRAPAP